jgi:hypothetical protein
VIENVCTYKFSNIIIKYQQVVIKNKKRLLRKVH